MNLARFSFVRLSAVVALGTLLFGCGGGGGSGSSTTGTGTFSFFVNFGSIGSGQSVVVALSDASGKYKQTQTLNASSTSPVQATFNGLPSETLNLQSTLYSGTKGSGTILGTTQDSVYGGSATTLTADVGATATTVNVTPTNPSVGVGSTVTLAAMAVDSSGNAVFEAGAPTWSLTTGSGTVANISSAGVVTGVAQGSATAQASFGSISGNTSVNVTSTNTGTWTIMLFLNAANSLDVEAPINIAQIEKIAQTPTSQTRFVIQYKLSSDTGSDPNSHAFNGTRRYLAVKNNLQLVQDMGAGVDMGSYVTLSNFVQWSMQNYPAQHYALILWDHGNGYRAHAVAAPKFRGISYDDQTGNHIDVWQLGLGSGVANSLASVLNGNKLDILSFDACLMQMIEVQDEVKGLADYMVCAEDNTPGPGYPYDLSFGSFFTTPTASTPTLAKGIVDGFFSAYNADQDYNVTPLSHSVVDLSQTSNVVTALNTFSQSLVSAGSSVGASVSAVRAASQAYDAADDYYFYDLGSITSRFASSSTAPSAVKTAATALNTAEKNAVVYSRNNSHSPDSTGISIEFGSYPIFSQYASTYTNLKLYHDTSWFSVLDSPTLNPSP